MKDEHVQSLVRAMEQIHIATREHRMHRMIGASEATAQLLAVTAVDLRKISRRY
jgi:hypothetical protein